jgi:hypothetical protein
MNQITWEMNCDARSAQSVLECESPLPLSLRRTASPAPPENARGLAHFKTWRRLVAWLMLATVALSARAQNYSIDWFKVAGGGGTSTGGLFSVSGTIGQPDAGGPMTNGQYSVMGGFWVLPTLVQTPGSPTLHINNSVPGWATIWWTPPTSGFVLQETPSLAPAAWTNSPSNTNNPATVPAVLPTRFYRLWKP